MSLRSYFQRSPHPQEFRPFGFFGFVMIVGGGWGLVSGVLHLGWMTADHRHNFGDWIDVLWFWLWGLAVWLAGGVWFGALSWFGIAWSIRRQLRSSGRNPDQSVDDIERS